MSISEILTVASLSLTLGAAFFLARGNLRLKPEHIAELGATKWDYNLDAIRGLAEEKAYAAAGMCLLLLAFACQLGGGLVPSPDGASRFRLTSLIVALGLSAIAAGVCFIAARRSAKSSAERAVQILKGAQGRS